MAIRGSLREASLPDVLQLLAMGRKSGCLSVTHRQAFGTIYFDRGRISYASIVNRRDRLGDLLVKNGLISAAELDAAVAAYTRQIASKSPSTLRLGLQALADVDALTMEQKLPLLGDRLVQCLSTDDAREGLMAFLKKRPPQWTGR